MSTPGLFQAWNIGTLPNEDLEDLMMQGKTRQARSGKHRKTEQLRKIPGAPPWLLLEVPGWSLGEPGSPGQPREAQGSLGVPREAVRIPGQSREAWGSQSRPGKLRAAHGPGQPRQARPQHKVVLVVLNRLSRPLKRQSTRCLEAIKTTWQRIDIPGLKQARGGH